MLVLARRPDEIVCIGDNVQVKVIKVREDGAVVLGFTAPTEIPIHRLEVYKAIQKATLDALAESGESP